MNDEFVKYEMYQQLIIEKSIHFKIGKFIFSKFLSWYNTFHFCFLCCG